MRRIPREVKAWYSKIGKRGGEARSPAQVAAVTANAIKARAALAAKRAASSHK